MTYPPPQGPPGPYGYPGSGPYTPPPKKNHTGVIVTAIVAVITLGVLAITGFVAPGFFLEEDSNTTSGKSAQSEQTTPPPRPRRTFTVPRPSTPPADFAAGQQLARKFLDKINSRDAPGATAMLCANATSARMNVPSVTSKRPRLKFKAGSPAQDKTALVPRVFGELSGTLNGKPLMTTPTGGEIAAYREGNGWCVYGFFAYVKSGS